MKESQLQAVCKFMLSNFEFICGKYFDKNTNKELGNIKNALIQYCITQGYIPTGSDINNLVDILVAYGYEDGAWPALYPNVKAKKHKLPFPLDDKQLQIINILLFHPEEEVIFITTGVGGSGKSTFLNIIKQLFNNDFAACSLSDLSNDFNIAEAVKHRLICSDELSGDDLKLPVLKTLASKQHLNVNGKNQTPYRAKTQSCLFYCCNKAPRIDLTDTGILRRIIYYERNTKIENPDKTLNKRIYTKDELMAIVETAKLYENPNWRDIFAHETHEYLLNNNPVYLYYKTYNLLNKPLHLYRYDEYVEFCHTRGYRAMNNSNYEAIMDLIEEWRVDESQQEILHT